MRLPSLSIIAFLASTEFAVLSLAKDEDVQQVQETTTAEAFVAPAPPYTDIILTRREPSSPLPINILNHITSGEDSKVNDPFEFIYGVLPDASIMNNDDDDDDDETNNGTTRSGQNVVFNLPPSVQDQKEECPMWAKRGECNINPNFMLRSCIRSCLDDMGSENYDLLVWGLIDEPNQDDRDCHDSHTKAVESGEIDHDADEVCEDWASEGLCKSVEDQSFMLTRCQDTCMVCIHPDNEDFGIGEPQEVVDVHLLAETLQIMIETSQYMSKEVMNTKNTRYHSVRRDCRNLDSYCAHMAAEGECHPDSESYEWMVLNCAPVCKTCELLDFSIRCPIPENAIEALARHGGENGLNAMFERIVGDRELTQKQIDDGMEDLEYTATIYSRPMDGLADGVEEEDHVIDGPWVVVLDNLLTDEECERLIELGHNQGYEQSTETTSLRDGSISEKQVSKRRTSTNAFCNACDTDPIARTATQKIATVTGFPVDFSEDLQLLQYHPGQYYKQHHDYIPTHKHGPSGPRVLTVLLYLNDVEEGGGTRFNELAEGAPPVDVQPKKGSALIWPSVLNEDILEIDDRTEHEALMVTKGMKYAANAWLHLRDEKNFQGIACG